MLLVRYCIAALLAGAPAAAFAQAPAAVPALPSQGAVGPGFAGDAEFTLFLAGAAVGTEQVHVVRAGSTWVISSTAQYGAPLNLTIRRFEVKYTPDWQPLELHLEATQATAQGARTLGLAT